MQTSTKFLSLLSLIVSGAIAVPTNGIQARDDCTVTDYSHVATAVANCKAITINGITVPAGTTLDLTKVQSGTTITFEGTTTFAFKEWAGPLISVAGTGITVTGSGTLDGLGAKYWDGKGSNSDGTTKPKFFYAHNLINSHINNIKILNSPVQVFSVDNSNYLTFNSVTIDNSAGASLGHNTDGFDIGSSTYVTINGANVHNQDDCIAVNSGTNLWFSGLTCTGGHGLSVGSVGGRSDNTVKNVTFINSSVTNSQNGVRIKTVVNESGSVQDVTYSEITLSGITKYGVVVEQDYTNSGATGTPTSGVPITNLQLKTVTGTVTSSAKDYYILCGSTGCSGWTFTGVSVTGGTGDSCNFKPSGFGCGTAA